MAGPEIAKGSLVAGRYRLERLLGEGGMGTVWAATHVVTRRGVAMKFLKPSLHNNAEVRTRFLREAQAASALRHPHVVEVIDVFDLEDTSPAMVMELLDGETLGEKLEREERLSAEETAAIMLPVISAVGSAHAAGIVHRDLKPDNIFLTRAADGVGVKVLDFGIAKLSAEHYAGGFGGSAMVTEAGSMLGTPCYMAPEQINNVGVDHRADIWSLGVILYECLSGTRPIEGHHMGEVLTRLMNEAIAPLDRVAPELPHDLAAIVQRALSRDVKRRPQELAEVARVLAQFTHVQVPPFGAPRAQSSGGKLSPAVEALRISSPELSAAASKSPSPAPSKSPSPMPSKQLVEVSAALPHQATMQSAPAVGIDGQSTGSVVIAGAPPKALPRRGLYVGAGAVALLLALIWMLGVDRTPKPAPSAAASSEPAPPPPGGVPVLAVPKVEPSAAPAVSAESPEDDHKKTSVRSRPSRAPVRPPLAPVVTPAPGGRDEGTLFSGRK